MRKLAIVAVGLTLFTLGPAATLVAPEPARADPPPTCTEVCQIVYVYQQNQCAARLPRFPTQDDQYDYGLCMIEAGINWMECRDSCPAA